MNYQEQVTLNLAEGQRVVPAEWVVIKGSRAAAEKAERATRQQPPQQLTAPLMGIDGAPRSASRPTRLTPKSHAGAREAHRADTET